MIPVVVDVSGVGRSAIGPSVAVLLVVFLGTGCVGSGPPPGGDLGEAVEEGDVARVTDLLDEGVDPERPVVLGLTPLMRAANRDDGEVATALLAGGADIDATGSGGLTALHVAARADAVDASSVLLQEGADPLTRSDSGMSTLDQAADAGALGVLRLLADHVDLDQPSEVVTQGHGHPRDRGPTPLSIAVRSGETEAVELLLDLGADVDGRSTSGHTPLLTAVFFDQPPSLVEVLLDAGADPGVRTACELGCSVGSKDELTAAEWARELDRRGLVSLLEGDG